MCSEVQHMSSTTQLQINPVVIDTQLETALICLNKKVVSKKVRFDSLLLDAVDSAFSMVSGSNSQALFSRLKNSFGISRETIPLDVEAFVDALEQVFGQGALLIEIQIMKSLHSKVPHFRFSSKQDALYFISYLENLCSYVNSM
jgi:hypothetical protein